MNNLTGPQRRAELLRCPNEAGCNTLDETTQARWTGSYFLRWRLLFVRLSACIHAQVRFTSLF